MHVRKVPEVSQVLVDDERARAGVRACGVAGLTPIGAKSTDGDQYGSIHV